MIQTQATQIVVQQFEHQIKLYTHHGSGADSGIIRYLVKYINISKEKNERISIIEFGGGNGALLHAIKKKLPQASLILTNAELVAAYRTHQIDPKIKFITSSILDSNMKDNTYNFVIIRNVLHHLVSDSIMQTRKNQQYAISEMIRIVKPGGLVLIEEQTNQSSVANIIIFFASLLATKLKINIPKLQITPYTRVGYLTQNELIGISLNFKNAKIIYQSYEKWRQPWWLKYPLLLFNNGLTLISIEKKGK